MKTRHWLGVLMAWSSLASPAMVHAQSVMASDQTPPDARADRSSDSGTIIVTAQSRAERLQDVPISLAVIGGETMQNRGITTFTELAPIVPGLTIARSPAANLILLRGIGSSPGSPSQDQSVVMFVDGIYGGNARQFTMPFLDIERVEILRGPQGALVGRNTSAGAINILSRRPGTEFGGYVEASYAFNIKGPTVEGGVDLPLSSAVRVRVAGKYADIDGYVVNTETGIKQPDRREAAGRIVAVFDNDGPVTVTAKYEHADVRSNSGVMQLLAPNRGYPRQYVRETFLVDDKEHDNIHTNNATLQADIDLGGLSLVATSGYSAFVNKSRIDADFYSGVFADAVFNQKFEQYSQEIRLLSPDEGALRYVLGAYYSTADVFEQRTTGVLFVPPASTYREFDLSTEVFSVFGQVRWNLDPALRVNLSGRYTRENRKAYYRRYGGPLASSDFIGDLVDEIDGHIKSGRFDPAVSVQYDLNSDAMIYASFNRGSKSGGFQGAIPNATQAEFAFRPEISTSYEAGLRLTLPHSGYLSLSAFRTIYKDLQVSATIPTGTLTTAIFTGNAPKARVTGVEAEFSVPFGGMFRIDGSASWMPDARYVDFDSGPCYPTQVPDGAVIGSCDQSGVRLGFTPKFSTSLNFTGEFEVGDDLKLMATVSPRYQTFSYRDFSPDPVTAQDAYAKLDARIALGAINGGWEIALVGQNLTDKLTVGFGGAGGLANTVFDPAARLMAAEPPRNISIQGRIRF